MKQDVMQNSATQKFKTVVKIP